MDVLAPEMVPETDWLDRLIAGTTPFGSGLHLLAGCPFQTVLAGLERAGSSADPATAIAVYQAWLANNPDAPLRFAAWFNLGTVLGHAGDRANAIAAFGNALALKPDLHVAAVNLGLQHEAAGDAPTALRIWEQALQPDAARLDLLIQRGRLLESTGALDQAERVLGAALAIDPTRPDVLHHWVHLRQKLCAWPVDAPPHPSLTPADLRRGSGPLGVLAITDDIAVQADAAASWVARKTTPAARRLAPDQGYDHHRTRIGYLSSDFCRHAMSYLVAELFERHDRARVEVYGYCSSRDDGSDVRARVLHAFDHVRFVRALTDEQTAEAIRADEIDILIDLNGLTDGTRLPVLRWRPAPWQGTYLGFVGGLPMPELDFFVCDAFTVPRRLASAYSPKPLPIPNLYQANDSKRTIGRPMTRAEAGLPEDAFVFACFSRHYKITQDVFADWLTILHAADHSVLWLAWDNEWSEANMRAAALADGIAPARIIFAPRIDPDLYMSRMALADLFLDTFPYNAGTVASDAMRMGLPLLTRCGDAFASRMAGSLLTALGVPEGITTDREDYVGRAITLANDTAHYGAFSAKFTRAAWDGTIGDIARFTRDFEGALLGSCRPRA